MGTPAAPCPSDVLSNESAAPNLCCNADLTRGQMNLPWSTSQQEPDQALIGNRGCKKERDQHVGHSIGSPAILTKMNVQFGGSTHEVPRGAVIGVIGDSGA